MSDWKNVQYKDGKMRTSEGGGGGSSTFAGLDDVSFNNIQNGQVPKYNSTTQKWENSNESGGGGTVTDVQVDGTSVVNPQTGVAEIEMPTPPAIPVEDVEVNGASVVNAQKVAEIKSYKEVTLAEYQALPSSKTSDGVMYCIKDVGGADSFPPLIYSDEEREVGVWRDGKPLYQKTIHKSNQQSTFSDYVTIESISNAEFKNVYGIAKRIVDSTHTLIYPLGTRPEENNSYFILVRTFDDAVQYRIGEYGTQITDLWVTVQYTKTTDTAGSGRYTTYGGIAHHYSTSEQVIGTWIDGKPLYERVFNISDESYANNQWKDTGIPKGSIKNIVSVVGFYGDSICFNFLGAKAESTDTNIMVLNTRGSNINLNRLILQYTKTTD